MKQFPTQQNCDPTKPGEAFLWMLVALPSGLQMPAQYWGLVSTRLWWLGTRPTPNVVKRLVPPSSVTQSWTDPGRWEFLGEKPHRPLKTNGDFPLRENCNPADPQEAFLWMFVALPHVNGGPLILSVDKHRRDSEHLWDCGARPVGVPEGEYVPPGADDPHWATTPGKWVPRGSISAQEKARAELRRGIARMGHAQKVEFKRALTRDRDGLKPQATTATQVVASMHPQLRRLALEVLSDPA